MRRKVIAILFIIMLLPGMVSADKTAKIDKLDQLSNEALQMVKLHRYEDAKKLLEYFSEQFVAVNGRKGHLQWTNCGLLPSLMTMLYKLR